MRKLLRWAGGRRSGDAFRFVDIKKRVFDEHHGLVSLVPLVSGGSRKWGGWVVGRDLCICGRIRRSSGMKCTRWRRVINSNMSERIPSRDCCESRLGTDVQRVDKT